MDGFTSINNRFITDTRFTAAQKMILIWLASKPADWQVREAQIRKELDIGPETVKRLLRELRTKGAITKPKPVRGHDGKWVRFPSTLAIRDDIRHVSPGQTMSGKSTSGPTCGNTPGKASDVEFPQVNSSVGFTTSGKSTCTSKDSDPSKDMDTLSKAATRHVETREVTPSWAPPSIDQTLIDLVRNAPDVKAIEALWKVHKADGQWNIEINELAKTRKAELASAGA